LEEEIRKFPLKSKRSVEEYNGMNEIRRLDKKREKLLEIYEKKYSALLREKDREEFVKR